MTLVSAAEKDLRQEEILRLDLATIHSATEKDQAAKVLDHVAGLAPEKDLLVHAAVLAAVNALLVHAVALALVKDLLPDHVTALAAVNAPLVHAADSVLVKDLLDQDHVVDLVNAPAAHVAASAQDLTLVHAVTISEIPKDQTELRQETDRLLAQEDPLTTENRSTDHQALAGQLREKLGKF